MGEGAGRRDFFPPLPLSLIYVKSINLSFKSVTDSPQLSGSINVQDGGIAIFPLPPKKSGSRCKIRLLYRLVVINILFILMAFSLDYSFIMLGEN